jgi:hypothetical protein
MGEPIDQRDRDLTLHVSPAKYVLFLALLLEIAVLFTYFGVMSFLILIGPGALEAPWWIALSIHLAAGGLYLVSFFGVGFCFFGVISRGSPVEWLLITLSTLGVLVLPIATYVCPEGSHAAEHMYLMMCIDVLLLLNTLGFFRLWRRSRNG